MYPYVVGTPQVQRASVKPTEVQAYQTRCAFVLYLNAIKAQFGMIIFDNAKLSETTFKM